MYLLVCNDGANIKAKYGFGLRRVFRRCVSYSEQLKSEELTVS